MKIKTIRILCMMLALLMVSFATLTACSESQHPDDNPEEDTPDTFLNYTARRWICQRVMYRFSLLYMQITVLSILFHSKIRYNKAYQKRTVNYHEKN